MALDGTALVRQEWEEGHRRLESERGDPGRYRVLLQQVDVIADELRRRVGQTYSLAELAAAYRDAERWSREAVEERAPSAGWPRDLALVLAAAFHGYQRGATDYLA
jgi:hypothetical protein